jgi:hypothetical protein
MNESQHRTQFWANLSTIIGALIAIAAVIVAVVTYRGSQELQKEVSAYQIWREHLALSFQYAEYSMPGPTSKVFTGQGDPDPKYEWYVGHALHAVELTLRLQPDDPGWKETAKDVMRFHRPYLASKHFKREHWGSTVMTLIEEVLAEKPR